MGESSPASKVLVVDDAPQIRALIRRVLSADGYDIDEAATLSQARSLAPAVYDAVVVDLRLADGSGADLIETLTASEPAAAAKCLVITGGGQEAVPDGAAYLRKPFYPDELLAAVRAIRQRVPGQGDAGTSAARRKTPSPPAETPPRERAPAAVPRGRKLLGMYRELRARERRAVADYLHDGPVQDLTGAVLELRLMRRAMPPELGRSLYTLLAAVDAATDSLRLLMDEPPSPAPGEELTSLLSERAGWLLGEPVTIDRVQTGDVGRAETPMIAETVALMLTGLVPAGSRARAHIAVRPAGDVLRIELALATTSGGERALRAPAAARGWLSDLAAALGGTVTIDFRNERWLVTLSLPRNSW